MTDKFFITPKERLPLPAKCWSCGATDRDCIDWGADLAFQGAILLCVVCVGEAATLLADPVDKEKETLRLELAAAQEALGGLRDELVSGIDRVFTAISGAVERPITEFAGSTNLDAGKIPIFKKPA